MAQTKFFLHVFAIGKNTTNLYHKYQDFSTGAWTEWILRAAAFNGTWDSDPAAGVNLDGRVEVFIRYSTNLDLWRIYQLDPLDATQWSVAEEASCVDMDGCAVKKGPYWNTQPVFPTSDVQVLNDPADGRLQVFYRGFDGALYKVAQTVISNSTAPYGPPQRFDSIFE